jgi:hypothetical protein
MANGAPGVTDTREDSQVTQNVIERVAHLQKAGLTAIAVYEKNDGLVPPDSASFPREATLSGHAIDDPSHIVNWQTEQPRLPSHPDNPAKLMDIFLDKKANALPGLDMMTDISVAWLKMMHSGIQAVQSQMEQNPWGKLFGFQMAMGEKWVEALIENTELVRQMNNPMAHHSIREMVMHGWRSMYADAGPEQHWTPVVFAKKLFGAEMREGLFKNPKKLAQLLEPEQFAGLRVEALRTVYDQIETQVGSLPQSEQSDGLSDFLADHPRLIQRLVDNARLGTAVVHSPTGEAIRVLDRLIDMALKDPDQFAGDFQPLFESHGFSLSALQDKAASLVGESAQQSA